jgi:hypothetical protein
MVNRFASQIFAIRVFPANSAIFKTGILFDMHHRKTPIVMASKTLATIVIIFACIIFIPLTIGIIGGVFGLIVGIFGGIIGLIGGLIGGIFGLIGSIFKGIFYWPFAIFHWNFFSVVLIVLVLALAIKSRR